MTDTRPFVVGIAGGTCSGKSTLAGLLEARFPDRTCRVIHMDSFFKKQPPEVVAPFSGKVYPEHNHPDTLDLPRLYMEIAAACESDTNLILIEGLFALYLEPVYSRCNLKLFVSLSPEERFYRRLRRHMASGEQMEDIAARYLDTVRFRHDELIEPTKNRADLIINGMRLTSGALWVENAIRTAVHKEIQEEQP